MNSIRKLVWGLVILLIIIVARGNAQSTYICGTINDDTSEKSIAFANIWIENTVIGTTSDMNGNYCIDLPEIDLRTINIVFSHLSYQQKVIAFEIGNKLLDVTMIPSTIQLSEVVVSANKNIDYTKEQTTLPIIVSSEIINQNSTHNIPELMLKQPGVSLVGTGYHTAPSIRGLSRKRVVILLNGEKVSSERNVGAPGSFVNPYEIERIEILKGPYSTLYGSDAIGGVVSIVTKDYDTPYYNDKIGGRVDMSFKSVNLGKNLNIGLNGQLNKVQYRVSAGYRDADEYHVPEEDSTSFNSTFQETYAGAKVRYDINENNEINIKAKYSKGGPIGFPAVTELVNAIHDYDNHFITGINYKKKNIGKYFKKAEVNMTRHAHDLGANINVHKVEENPANDKLVKLRKDLEGVDYITQLDLYFRLSNKLKILTGFDGYFRENIDIFTDKKVYNYQTGTFIIAPPGEGKLLDNASQRSMGIFAQTNYSLSDKAHANVGVRWNKIQTRQPGQSEKDRDNSAFSGNLGLSYSPVKAFSIKANVGSAFRVPDIKELYLTTQTPGGLNISNPDLIPEQSINYDLAFVYKSKTSLVQLSGFFNTIDNLIVTDWDLTTNPRTGTFKNIGKAELYGAEFSYNQKLTDDISAYINMSKTYGYDVNADDILIDVPPFQSNIGVKYRMNNDLQFNLSGRHSGEQTDVAKGDYPTEAFTTLDFSTRWKILPNLSANFSVTNLLNKKYKEHYYFDWIYAPARSFNLGVHFNF